MSYIEIHGQKEVPYASHTILRIMDGVEGKCEAFQTVLFLGAFETTPMKVDTIQRERDEISLRTAFKIFGKDSHIFEIREIADYERI